MVQFVVIPSVAARFPVNREYFERYRVPNIGNCSFFGFCWWTQLPVAWNYSLFCAAQHAEGCNTVSREPCINSRTRMKVTRVPFLCSLRALVHHSSGSVIKMTHWWKETNTFEYFALASYWGTQKFTKKKPCATVRMMRFFLCETSSVAKNEASEWTVKQLYVCALYKKHGDHFVSNCICVCAFFVSKSAVRITRLTCAFPLWKTCTVKIIKLTCAFPL